ncbi:MAG: ATP synthase subunit I [Caldimonas sp.]
MAETLPALAAGAAGAVLGAIYFGGLWWTVSRLASFRRPALSVAVSALLRMGLALGGFYLIAGGDWLSLLACLLGFVAARAVVTGVTRPPRARREASGTEEAGHAP